MEEYLKQLVNFYPVSSNQDAVLRLLTYCKEHFESKGLHAEILDYGKINNLYVSRNGEKHVKLLLQGHVDVVPGDNQPYKETEDSLEGRGTFDMLFAAACYMQLVDDLTDKLSDLDMGILLSGDEEVSGENGVKAFLAAGYTCDVCLLPDAGDGYGKLSIGAKGIYELSVRIQGKSHHGSRPWEGDGAAAKAVHFLSQAEKLFDTGDRQNSTMTISKLAAGDAMNRGPAYTDIGLDIRYKDSVDFARIKKQLTDLLEQYNGEVLETLAGDDYQLDTSNTLVQHFLALYSKQIGHSVEQTIAPGSSDARFFTKCNTPVIMLRPDGGGAHGDNEWVSRESLHQFYNLLKEYVLEVA